MHATRRAVIDVGTNSVKLLVADVAGGEVTPVTEESHQTRLGKDFYQSHILQAEPIKLTAAAVAEFVATARAQGAVTLRIIATSAARDARNAGELISAIHQTSGFHTEVITGEQEADLAFKGVTTDKKLSQTPLLLLDIGGGSTEFIVGQGTEVWFRQSFPLGTVRLMGAFPHHDTPKPEELSACSSWVEQFLQREVRPAVQPILSQQIDPLRFIGTGGTASILARMEASLPNYDREKIEKVSLNAERLSWHVNHLWSQPLSVRRNIVGLPPSRADVILTGALIFQMIQKHFELPPLRITTRGLRFAAVMSGGEPMTDRIEDAAASESGGGNSTFRSAS